MSTKRKSDGETDEEPVAVWERQPGETPKQYRAFCVYRELGPDERSLNRARSHLGYRSQSHLDRWSSENDWTVRVKAYDDFLDRQRRADQEQKREATARHEFRLIEVIYSLVMRRFLGWDGGGDPSRAVAPLDPNTLTARDASALLREATRMVERRPEKRNWLREATLRATTIAPSDYERELCQVIELALTHLPEDARSRFAEELRAYLTSGYTPRNRG